MRRPTFFAAAAALIFTSLAGTIGCPDGGGETECDPGFVEGPNGNCIRERDDDNGDDTGTRQDTTADTRTRRDTGTDTSNQTCTEECGSQEFCLEGSCVQGANCEPNEALGCVDDDTLRVCTSKGVGFRKEQCPTDKPNCIDFRKDGCTENKPECFESRCTSKTCSPGTKFCGDDGTTVLKCNSSGTGSSQVEQCRGKCEQGECVSVCQGNAKSYIGCGFYAIDMDNYTIQCGSDSACQQLGGLGGGVGECVQGVCTCTQNSGSSCQETNVNDQQYAVTISNTSDSKVNVDFLEPGGSTVKSTTVQPGNLKAVDLPDRHTEDSGLSKQSYRIQSSGPVTAHQFNPKNQAGVFSNDASLLLPSSTLGTEYTVIGWGSMPAPQNPQQIHQTGRPYVTVVAVESGSTQVQIETPTEVISGQGVGSLSPGSSAAYTLSEGEVVQLMAKQKQGNDLTGMTVSADQDVAVFSGHECSEIPVGTAACDHLEQQLLPESTWGKSYILSKFKPRGTEPDFYRIVAAKDGTTIQTEPPLSRLDGKTLDAGEKMEFELKPSLVVKADKPISIGQFMVGSQHSGVTDQCQSRSTEIGDPAFMIDVPETQYRKEYVVFTPNGYQEDWLNIVKRTRATVTIDGSSLSKSGTEIGNTGWEVVRKAVQPGTHSVSGSSPIGLYAYGYECDVSYAYPGGLDLAAQRRRP